jgi:hypothetical protein
MFTLNWGLFEHLIKALLNNMEKHTHNVDKDAAALHFHHMKEARERTERDADEYERRRKNAMIHEVLEWLSADEDGQENILHQLSDSRQDGTCDWILSIPKFQSWVSTNTNSAIVWIRGKPGSGEGFKIFRNST